MQYQTAPAEGEHQQDGDWGFCNKVPPLLEDRDPGTEDPTSPEHKGQAPSARRPMLPGWKIHTSLKLAVPGRPPGRELNGQLVIAES